MSTEFALVQSSLRRRWELRRGDVVEATLVMPVLRSTARAHVGDVTWQLRRVSGRVPGYVVHDEGGHPVLDASVPAMPEVDVYLRSGVLRTSGTVEIGASLPERETIALALVAACLAIRKAERDAASGSAAISSTSV